MPLSLAFFHQLKGMPVFSDSCLDESSKEFATRSPPCGCSVVVYRSFSGTSSSDRFVSGFILRRPKLEN